MSKFGEIINSEIPVLIHFYNYINDENEVETAEFLKQIASKLGEKARVIKIDIDKNTELVKALIIKDNPTFVIYKDSEMKWRHGGKLELENLIDTIKQFH
jgi:thioredoxin 1